MTVSPDSRSTVQLLEHARGGDPDALNTLFARYHRPLTRWASGRLPQWARHSSETHDLVQDTLLNAFKRIDTFEPRREGAFQAFLRQAVMNRIRDEIRRAKTRPARETFEEVNHAREDSPLEHAIGAQTVDRYEAALTRLRPEDREAIIGRVELDNSYEELAVHLGKPSVDAARMAVARALLRLAEEMKRVRRS